MMQKLWPLLLLLSLSCATPGRVSLAPPTRAPAAADYLAAVNRWTRHGIIHNEFDTSLTVDATMRSPEFRAAYAEHYLDLYRVGTDSRDRIRSEILADGADRFEFHVETSTHTFELNDLTSKKTVWRLSLINDQGREVSVEQVTQSRVRREIDTIFFPYASIFSKSWRIRFPRTLSDGTALVSANTRSLTLRFSGPDGSVDLTWLLE